MDLVEGSFRPLLKLIIHLIRKWKTAIDRVRTLIAPNAIALYIIVRTIHWKGDLTTNIIVEFVPNLVLGHIFIVPWPPANTSFISLTNSAVLAS